MIGRGTRVCTNFNVFSPSKEFWAQVTVSKLESVCSQVRDLIKFLKTEEQKTVETNFKDEIIEKDSKHINPQTVTKLLGEYLSKYNFNPA